MKIKITFLDRLKCKLGTHKWKNINQEMLKPASEKVIKKYSEESKTKEKIEVISFGSVLTGYKFTYNNSNGVRLDRFSPKKN